MIFEKKRKTVALGSDAKGLAMRAQIPTDKLYTHSDVNPGFQRASNLTIPA